LRAGPRTHTVWRALLKQRRRVILHAMRLVALLVVATAISASAAVSAPAAPSWLVRVGPGYVKVGEYRIGLRNTRFLDVINAFGKPSTCRVISGPNHVQATWASRALFGEFVTFGGLPRGENGCMSPDLIHVSELRVNDRRWHTALGLAVGDPTLRLRRLYPRARYVPKDRYRKRDEYWLATRRGVCFGDCGGRRFAKPVLTAEVRRGRITAFWIPVGAQGE